MKLPDLLAAKQATLCDTALGNTPAEAETGNLNAFAGVDQATVATLRPVIETWAKTVVDVGEVGSGHKVKLINNFIGMCKVATYAEVFAACQAIGETP